MRGLLNRFKEPSSWAGIAVLVSTVAPNVPSSAIQTGITTAAGICALAAFFVKEKAQ